MPKSTNKRRRAQSPHASNATKRLRPNNQVNRGRRIMADASAAVLAHPVDYRDLKAWIAEQEALPEPVPLTKVQLRAITDLKNSLKVNTDIEINTGNKDWVSIVHRYRDAHQELGVRVEFHDFTPCEASWLCHLTFKCALRDEHGEPMDKRFPDLDAGFVPIGPNGVLRQPAFARKKDAKHYAAKCCVEFLMKKGMMPSDGKSVSFPKPKMPQAVSKKKKGVSQGAGMVNIPKPAVINSSSSSNTSTPYYRPSTPADTTNTNTRAPKDQGLQLKTEEGAEAAAWGGAPLFLRDEDFSATYRVAEICNRLGINPPTYRIEPADPSTTSFFNGFVDFGNDNIQMPDSVRVLNCRGKKFTKENLAEKVLEYLRKIEAKRNADADELIRIMTDRALEDDGVESGEIEE